MGAGSSSLSAPKLLTNDELKSGSEDIRRMSNALFQFMYTKWEPKDVWEIANNPSKYVIAISDLITTQFHVLGYTRKDGKLGEIYFKEWKDLKPPMSTGDYDKEAQNAKNSNNTRRKRRERNDKNYEIQKRNSEIIAFYFVRIFQILGALLLVVKDFNIPSFNPETGEEVVATSNNASRNFAHQAYQVVSAFRPPSMKGGARMSFDPQMPLGPYDFLRFYLRQADEDDISNFKTKGFLLDRKREFMFEGSDTMIFEFTPYKDAADIRADTKPSQKIGILVKNSANGMYEKVYIQVFVSDIQFESEGGFVNMIQGYKAPAERPEKEKETAYPREVVLDMVLPVNSGGNNKVTFSRIGKTKSLNLGSEYQVTKDSKKFVENLFLVMPSMKKSDFVKMLQRVLISGLRQTRGELEDVTFEKKIETEATGAEKDKPKPPNNKSLKDTFSELVKDNHQPHCIARALQLLDSASISGKFNNRMGNTKVCKDALGGKSSMKLSDYTPTRSLGQLFGKINPLDYQSSINVLKAFVQKESTGNPLSTDAVGNVPSEKDELQAAIKRLTTAFNIVYSDQKDLASVEVKISSKCDPKDIGKDIEIGRDSNTFREMRTASQKLLAYHLTQITRISEFLKKIFNISQRGDGSWKVEGPKTELLFAGFEVMNDLTNQARALLLDYYAGCEEIYQGGLKAWEASAAPAVNRGSPGPGAVLPSAPRLPSGGPAPPPGSGGPPPPGAGGPAPPPGANGPAPPRAGGPPGQPVGGIAPPAVGGQRRRKSK